MKYLENRFCTLTPHFDLDPSVKKKLISVVFFEMNNPYKPVSKYTGGLNILIKLRKQLFPDFRIRLFLDSRTLTNPAFERFRSECEVVEFSCPPFLSDRGRHRGTFGTLVRLLPLFDLPNNDASEVVVVDADIKESELHRLQKLLHLLREHAPKTALCSHGHLLMSFLAKHDHPYPQMFSGRMISLARLPSEVITGYLGQLNRNEIKIGEYYADSGKYSAADDEVFKYGIDEYFLNSVVVPYCEKNDYLLAFYSSVHLNFFPRYLIDTKQYRSGKLFFEMVLGHQYAPGFRLRKLTKEFDRVIYVRKPRTHTFYIATRVWHLIESLRRREDYRIFPKKMVDAMLDRYRGIVNGDGLVFNKPGYPMRHIRPTLWLPDGMLDKPTSPDINRIDFAPDPALAPPKGWKETDSPAGGSHPYLENRFCRFTPHFRVDPSARHDIIAISLFKIPTPYRKFHYYEKGLRIISDARDAGELGEVKLRLFVDSTITSDPALGWLKEKFELVEFECGGFKEGEYHAGLFGTFARFFPMFDYPGNDARRVYIFDADVHTVFQSFKQQFDEVKSFADQATEGADGDKLHLVYMKSRYYDAIDKYFGSVDPHSHIHAMAGKLVSDARMPTEIFDDFLEMLEKNPEYSKGYYDPDPDFPGRETAKYPYGIDEYFLNRVLLPELEERKLVFAYHWGYSILSFFERIHQRIAGSEPELEELLKQVLGFKFKNYRKGVGTIRWLLRSDKRRELKKISQKLYPLLHLISNTGKAVFMGREKMKQFLAEFDGITAVSKIAYSDNRPPILLDKF